MKKNIQALVIKNKEIATGIYRIELERNKNFGKITPGQFLHIKCGKEDGLILRRPISISYWDDTRIGIIVRRVGKGTELLTNVSVGDRLDILGPLGNGFQKMDHYKRVIILGGGIGIAPMLGLAKELKDKKPTILLGYRDETFLEDEFKLYGSVKIATEDGNKGFRGFVTELLIEEVNGDGIDIIYTCGPTPMLREVQKISHNRGIELQVSVEEKMACGIGACLVCACKTTNPQGVYKYVKTCKDGPIFNGKEVIL